MESETLGSLEYAQPQVLDSGVRWGLALVGIGNLWPAGAILLGLLLQFLRRHYWMRVSVMEYAGLGFVAVGPIFLILGYFLMVGFGARRRALKILGFLVVSLPAMALGGAVVAAVMPYWMIQKVFGNVWRNEVPDILGPLGIVGFLVMTVAMTIGVAVGTRGMKLRRLTFWGAVAAVGVALAGALLAAFSMADSGEDETAIIFMMVWTGVGLMALAGVLLIIPAVWWKTYRGME